MPRLAFVVALLASSPLALAQGHAASVREEWGTVLMAIGVVTMLAGAVGGLHYSNRWAAAHGHAATLFERIVGTVLGACGGLMVPALVHLMITLSR